MTDMTHMKQMTHMTHAHTGPDPVHARNGGIGDA
jgi:hypothetical protein